MDGWEKMEREREAVYFAERRRLLDITDLDAITLSHPDQYQRMRFLREIEAEEYLRKIGLEHVMKKPIGK